MGNNWEEMPTDILAKIAEHVELYDDYEAFTKVCSSWRLAIKQSPHQYINKNNTQLPWLMLVDPDDSPYRRYYSLTKRKFLKIDLSHSVLGVDNYKDDQIRRYFSSRGWLISVTQKNHRITLFNPFSKTSPFIEAPRPPDRMDLPYADWKELMLHCIKFALSATPTEANDNDYVIAMIYDANWELAFWRPGQHNWVSPLGHIYGIHDVLFFQGEFYTIGGTIGGQGIVRAYGSLNNIDLDKQLPSRIVADLGSPGLVVPRNTDKMYLVESINELGAPCLLVVHRTVSITNKNKYKTVSFRVFELNVANGEAKQVKTLRNRAIFVGFNSSFSVKASSFDNDNDEHGCKVDCIYYTDDNWEVYGFCKKSRNGGGRDTGIYSLALDKWIHLPRNKGRSHCSLITPPMWVEFSNFSL